VYISRVWGEPPERIEPNFFGGRCPRRNHLIQFWWWSVKGCSVGQGSNFTLSHWLWWSSLQRSHTTVWACDHELLLHRRMTVTEKCQNSMTKLIVPFMLCSSNHFDRPNCLRAQKFELTNHIKTPKNVVSHMRFWWPLMSTAVERLTTRRFVIFREHSDATVNTRIRLPYAVLFKRYWLFSRTSWTYTPCPTSVDTDQMERQRICNST